MHVSLMFTVRIERGKKKGMMVTMTEIGGWMKMVERENQERQVMK